MIFTDDIIKRFEDFVDSDFVKTDDYLGIRYETKDIQDDTILLLRYNCPDAECDVACLSWSDLHRHVKTIHHKMMCHLCTHNKKVFTHEHDLYTVQDLKHHQKHGDGKPGEADTTGFKGHPECGFCRERFYGDDELFVHCRDKHEKCHICERRNNGRTQQYYVNYDALEQHFRKDHFVCLDQECLDKKFVVFGSEMDLKAHQLEAHPNGLTKDARRDARRVDISTFDYRTPHTNRDGRVRTRGRDPNSEPLPPSSAQTLRRDEIAYQRQMAIQNTTPSLTNRAFGGQLSSTNAYAAAPNNRSQEPTTVTGPRNGRQQGSMPVIDSLTVNQTPAATPTAHTADSLAQLTPQEHARRIQHNAVVDRAAALLNNDAVKLDSFRTHVSLYRTSAVTATQMIDLFLALFSQPAAEVGKLVKELADLYDSDAKRRDLLKAWNDWRAINEDYPTLPGPAGNLPGANTASTGRRILKLKSSTAQSSRSLASQQHSWGAAVPSAALSSRPAPASSANRVGAGHVGPVPWTTSSSSRPAPSATPRPVPKPNNAAAPRADAFPALPAAARPNTAMMGVHRGTVAWDDRRGPAAASPWGGASGGSMGANAKATTDGEEQSGDGEGKRKGRKGKQTLYRFG